ncbi:MAG: hypothetical protein V1777_04185 [Candidatus Micrarchaeota archaeon]
MLYLFAVQDKWALENGEWILVFEFFSFFVFLASAGMERNRLEGTLMAVVPLGFITIFSLGVIGSVSLFAYGIATSVIKLFSKPTLASGKQAINCMIALVLSAFISMGYFLIFKPENFYPIWAVLYFLLVLVFEFTPFTPMPRRRNSQKNKSSSGE